jgi:hypothetical protein
MRTSRRIGPWIGVAALGLAAMVGLAQAGEHSMGASQGSAPAWSAPDPAWKAPGTARAAQARLRSLWPAIVSAAPGVLTPFDDAMRHGRCAISARPLPCHDAAARVRDTVGGGDPAVLGSVDALADGACWETSCGVGFQDLLAYLRATDGTLLMLWLPPEG